MLTVSNLLKICHSYDIRSVQLPLTIYGQIPAADGSTQYIESQDALLIPSIPEIGVTPRTTVYVTDLYNTGLYQGIGINLL